MWLFPFILFGILGWCTFVKPPEGGNARLFLMIVYVVIMLLWALVGATGFELSSLKK